MKKAKYNGESDVIEDNTKAYIHNLKQNNEKLEAENKELRDKLEEYVVHESVNGILKIQIIRDTLNELLNNKQMKPEDDIKYLKLRLSTFWFWQRTKKKRYLKRIENIEAKIAEK